MNKATLFLWLPCVLLFARASAEAGPLFAADDEWMQQKVKTPNNISLIDDVLISLSHESSANIFADATHIDVKQKVQPYGERQRSPYEAFPDSLSSVAGNLTRQANLSYDRSNSDTLVFWNKPDTQHLVELIVAYQKKWDAEHPAVDEKSTFMAMQEFLSRVYAWKPTVQTLEDVEKRAEGVDAFISMNELTPELKVPVETELFAQLRRVANAPDYHSFDAVFWKDARLRVIKDTKHVLDPKGKLIAKQPISLIQLFTSGTNPANMVVGVSQWQLPVNNTKRPAKPQAVRPLPNQQEIALGRAEQPQAPISRLDLAGEPLLKKPVSFVVKRGLLLDFLTDLQKQSGVLLRLAPNAFQGALITANSKGMGLSSAMGALERLYSSHWKSDGQGYTLIPDNLDELHLLMAQEGLWAYYGSSPDMDGERGEIGNQLADEIVEVVNPDQLQSREGAPFAALPINLQDRALRLFRDDNATNLVVAQQRFDDVQKEDVRFRFSPLPQGTARFFGAFHTPGNTLQGPLSRGAASWGAYAKDGRFITEMFPNFSAAKPTEMEKRLMKSRQDAEAFAGSGSIGGDGLSQRPGLSHFSEGNPNAICLPTLIALPIAETPRHLQLNHYPFAKQREAQNGQ